MPYDRPTLAELDESLRADITSRLPGTDPLLRRSFLGAFGRGVAGGLHELYGFQEWIADQAFPDTADTAELLRWAAIWGVEQVAAQQAEGAILVEGTAGTVIPAGTLWRSGSDQDYETDAEFVMPAAATGNIDVTAIVAGAAGNAAVGVILNLVNPNLRARQPSERLDGDCRRGGHRVHRVGARAAARSHPGPAPRRHAGGLSVLGAVGPPGRDARMGTAARRRARHRDGLLHDRRRNRERHPGVRHGGHG